MDIVLIKGFDASMNRLQAARSMCVTDRIDIVTCGVLDVVLAVDVYICGCIYIWMYIYGT